MSITIKRVSIEEADTLLRLSREVFFEAFAHLNHADDMAVYADKAFTIERISEELSNPDSFFYFTYFQDTIAGYLKLNYKSAQTEFQDPDALEIERIYVAQQFQNKQIGRQLMQFSIQEAVSRQLRYIWLGVWEHNTNAIRFYQNQGFSVFDSHQFMLGNDEQTDLLMKKPL